MEERMSKSFEPKNGGIVAEGFPHTWGMCDQCGWFVRCAYCGNNCCNGGSGDGCKDRCHEAYQLQDEWYICITPDFND